ncbi:MAG: phosphate signaling complex protein PhoU [Clostridiales bacterium]|nr:phosphate signaling complex protein PhoU [Clostridiales bacterium]
MRNQFDRQLTSLNSELIAMGEMVEESIENAIDAMVNKDEEKAKANVEFDDEIDRKMRDIEALCMKLLMKQQPVASDLRLISAALKMITDMERIGDHAADISEMSIYLAGVGHRPKMDIIKKMAAQSMVMVVDAIQAFVEKDLKKAEEVYNKDDIMDALFVEAKEKLIETIRERSDVAEIAADLLLISKYLERIGDHAANIAGWVIYSISGVRR